MQSDLEIHMVCSARKVFLQKGFSDATMQDIAQEAGVSRTTLNYYFRTKERLFDAIFEELFASLRPEFERLVEMPTPIVEKIEVLVDFYTAALMAHPDFPLLVLMETRRDLDHFIAVASRYVTSVEALQIFLRTYDQERAEGKILDVPLSDVLLTMMSVTIFPFLCKDVFERVFQGQSLFTPMQIAVRKRRLVAILQQMLIP